MSFTGAEIKEYYAEWWENPRDIRNMVFDRLNRYVRKRLPSGQGRKALDIGSGHGRIVSYLVEKGYDVSAVEFNEGFVSELRGKYPAVNVIEKDVRDVSFAQKFDVVTCIELAQNLEKPDLLDLLVKLSGITRSLLINISNRNSFHGRWVELRGWKKNFVFDYTPQELDRLLKQAGFAITHRRGIGLVTPASLFKDFKGRFTPFWLTELVNKLDPCATGICHLYYVEAISNNYKEEG